jgi:hypothetical protein
MDREAVLELLDAFLKANVASDASEPFREVCAAEIAAGGLDRFARHPDGGHRVAERLAEICSARGSPLPVSVMRANWAASNAARPCPPRKDTATKLKMLDQSIGHWSANVVLAGRGEGVSRGWASCALCVEYGGSLTSPAHASRRQCVHCPVRKATGRTLCRGTPYDELRPASMSEPPDWGELELVSRRELGFLMQVRRWVAAGSRKNSPLHPLRDLQMRLPFYDGLDTL